MIKVPITPADFDVGGGGEIVMFRPHRLRDVSAFDHNTGVPAVTDHIH